MNLLTSQIITEARKYIGHKEVTRNDSPLIREWLRRVGVTKPSAWCAAGAWCMLADACAELGVKNIVPPTAGAHRLLRRARELGLWTNEPGPGYIFGIDHGKGLGHVGIVEEVGPTSLVTIEFNTNGEGSREGDRVARRTRRLGEISLGYLDPSGMIK